MSPVLCLAFMESPSQAGESFMLACSQMAVPPGHCIRSLCSLDTDQRYSARWWGELKASLCITSQAFCPRRHIFLIFTKALHKGGGGVGRETGGGRWSAQLHWLTILEHGKGVSHKIIQCNRLYHSRGVLFIAVTLAPGAGLTHSRHRTSFCRMNEWTSSFLVQFSTSEGPLTCCVSQDLVTAEWYSRLGLYLRSENQPTGTSDKYWGAASWLRSCSGRDMQNFMATLHTLPSLGPEQNSTQLSYQICGNLPSGKWPGPGRRSQGGRKKFLTRPIPNAWCALIHWRSQPVCAVILFNRWGKEGWPDSLPRLRSHSW